MVSVLEFKVDDIYRAPEIAQKIEAEAGKGFMSTNWMEQNRALFHALRLERIVTFITIGLIVFVAALNILISLIMMVMEKTRDIAVLVSMGARKRQIRRIFMFQGILIGVIGTVMGLIVGYALAYVAGHYHLLSLSAEVYSIDYVPFAPRLMDGLLVAWWPSASRSLPRCIPRGRPPACFPPRPCAMSDPHGHRILRTLRGTLALPAMPRITTRALRLALLAPMLVAVCVAQGTRTWTQDKYDDFEKGTARDVAIASTARSRWRPASTRSTLRRPLIYGAWPLTRTAMCTPLPARPPASIV